jgi:RNA polymerase sigma-70 factor (ECF subfamily)
MLTTRKYENFERESAEVPHPRVANARTGSEVEEGRGEICLAASARDVIESAGAADPRSALIAAAKTGDRTALEQLLATERPRAMAAALRVLHNPDDAEDAVQDAFLKIWHALPAFEGRSAFSTWVHRIVTNASLDVMRKSAARAEIVEHPELKPEVTAETWEPANDETPESALADREIETLVRLAVAALPDPHRQAVELREFEDCSYQEMADIIRCPIGTVMSRLHHARGKLAEELRGPLAHALAA